MSTPDQPYQEVDLALVRRYLDVREAEQNQLAHLQSATERLSEDTAALRKSLDTYATKDAVKAIDDRHATELVAEERNRLQALVALRLKIRKQTWILFGIVIALLAAAAIYFYISTRDYRHDRFVACQQRNSDVVRNANQGNAFFGPKLSQYLNEHKHPDPVVVGILTALANEKPQLVRCAG